MATGCPSPLEAAARRLASARAAVLRRADVRTVALFVLALGLVGAARPGAAPETEPVVSPVKSANRQLLLVRSASWAAASGTLERYTRDQCGHWSVVGAAIQVNIGRNGMAWGRGLHAQPKAGPFKREGDGRSPSGAFALSTAFGAAARVPEGAHDFPFLSTRASSYCVEDQRSKFYNQLIDSNDVPKTSWEKWSELRRADGLFDWGVVVQQNAPDTQKGAGSCVFLHIWRGPRIPTAGCTAMPRDRIEAVVAWLDPHAEPLLVQLPEPVYQQVREPWGLP
jgi:D-alanyl-D-alanine dipeptidase